MAAKKKSKAIRAGHKNAIIEGVFVLSGILIAFLIDTSWSNWQESKAERQRLSVLKTELSEVQNDLLRLDEFYDEQDSLIKEILKFAGTHGKDYRRLDTLLVNLGPFFEYSPILIAYNDATQGGNLSRIQSIELRHALVEYKSSVDYFVKAHIIIRQHFESQMSPLWVQYVNVRNHVAVSGLYQDYPDVPLQPRYEDLVNDLRFSNQLIERGIFVKHIRSYEKYLKESIKALLELLDDY